MIFATCIKCRNRDFERPDKGAYLVSRKVEVVVETFSVTYYSPVLLVAGLLTGLVIGIVAEMMLKRLVNIQF